MIIITSPRIPEEEFKFQKKVTTEDGRLKISTEIYEDVQQLVRRCHVIIEFAPQSTLEAPVYKFHKGEQALNDFIAKLPAASAQPEAQTAMDLSADLPQLSTFE